jgi:hypothetical protein
MYSRLMHALLACTLFSFIARLFGVIAGRDVHGLRVLLWSVAGIGVYMLLSHVFGFDPHRTRLRPFASEWTRYVDRWELRSGQATLSMLGIVIVAAHLLDGAYFVTAVVSGTLAAHLYFIVRLLLGAYTANR